MTEPKYEELLRLVRQSPCDRYYGGTADTCSKELSSRLYPYCERCRALVPDWKPPSQRL